MTDLARAFRQLHTQPEPLIPANVWDSGGGRVVESLGARAVATSSAGVAWAMAYADGNQLPLELLFMLAQNIVRAIRIPPSMDIGAVGDVVVAWAGTTSNGCCTPGQASFQRYAANGTALGSNVVFSHGNGPPSVAMNPDGSFAVAWNESGEARAQLFEGP